MTMLLLPVVVAVLQRIHFYMAFCRSPVRAAQSTLQPLVFSFAGVQSKAGLVGAAPKGREED